jgi:tetratricopeptide (TPR) repeat protein
MAHTMRGQQTEYVLKGIYLGLLAFVALRTPTWQALGTAALYTLGGLALFLVIAALPKLREGYKLKGKLLPFVLFLLLESPLLVYSGILLGTALGAFAVAAETQDENKTELLLAVAGGAVLGVVFGLLRNVQERKTRLGLCLALAVAVMAGALYLMGWFPDSVPQHKLKPENMTLFSVQLLLGIFVFYLLTFAGTAEESEVEIGMICAALGLGLGTLMKEYTQFQSLGFFIPVLLYFYYTMSVLPRLRVFKYVVRGYSYAKVGRFRQALLAFRRAVQLDPSDPMAREGLWSVHRAMDFVQLANDPETLALIDFDLCLDRAGSLLLEPSPTSAKLDEAHRLLDLVLNQRPDMKPRVCYWRCVAALHVRDYDRAAAELELVLDPSHWSANDPQRRLALLPAWRLALTLHEEMRRRVGLPQIVQPRRRMEAIAAVERHLADNPDDRDVWNLKRLLYQDLTEADYDTLVEPGRAAAHFDHEYTQQLGLALINDPNRWQRGGEYLRMAARGLPALGPTMYIQIAQANERAGNPEGAMHNYELAKKAGLTVGHANLGDEDKQAFFATVKMLGEVARQRGDIPAAIDNYRLFLEWDRSGLETLRVLADLYEKKGDALAALWFTEQALIFDSKDKDLLERKDRYYYSVMPDDLRARLEVVKNGFDTTYCLKKARSVLDTRTTDLELLDWAQHLAELAHIVQPDWVAPKVLLARARLRRGEKEEAVAALEAIHTNRPEKFASGDDEDAWYLACRLLGEMYLYELGRPDLAVPCFSDYRKYGKSGADTIYKLGQAYEQLGDRVRAMKCYENVAAYDGHPLAHEANDALYRLKMS